MTKKIISMIIIVLIISEAVFAERIIQFPDMFKENWVKIEDPDSTEEYELEKGDKYARVSLFKIDHESVFVDSYSPSDLIEQLSDSVKHTFSDNIVKIINKSSDRVLLSTRDVYIYYRIEEDSQRNLYVFGFQSNSYGLTIGFIDSIKLNIPSLVSYGETKKEIQVDMVDIPGKKIKMSQTEVTQKLYESIMDSNPSYCNGDNNPVESVSWYDTIYFCNKLSEKSGKTPVYSVDGTTDISKWNYTPHNGNKIEGEVIQNMKANGFRLPTVDEWQYAAKGGQDYKYAGSANLDEVGWYYENSEYKTHPVAQKKANGYGLYDMSGNVQEWCWDAYKSDSNGRWRRGGCCYGYDFYCWVDDRCYYNIDANRQYNSIGFRIICSADN